MSFELDDLNTPAFQLLSEHIEAQKEANRLKQAEVNSLRRREQLSLDERDETVKLRMEVRNLINELEKLSEEVSATTSISQLLAQQVKELKELIAKIDDTLLLLLTEHSQSLVNVAATEASNRKAERQNIKNLEILRERAAKYGPLDIPLSLQNQINELERILNRFED
jgi:hypothetical protein